MSVIPEKSQMLLTVINQMSHLEQAIILDKLNFLERYLKQLEEYDSVPLEDYLKYIGLRLAIERLIELIIQVGIDLNLYFLTQLNREIPEQSRDAIVEIEKLKIIESELVPRLIEWVELRNILVYDYAEINPIRVHGAIKGLISDYWQYQQSILKYLAFLEE